jgi:hypothetical protein
MSAHVYNGAMKPSIATMVAWVALGYALNAEAADPKSKGSGKVNLDLPSFGAIPKGDDIVKPKAKDTALEPSVTATSATYSVTKILHGKAFTRTTTGSVPSGPAMEVIPLSGNPLSTPRFQSVVRVKSPQKVNAPIDVVILDNRGDTAMSASGQVNFKAAKTDEVDYQVEWDPTPTRAGGDFQVLVRIGGQVMGTWPLKMVEEKK